jgi:hypothetical protein
MPIPTPTSSPGTQDGMPWDYNVYAMKTSYTYSRGSLIIPVAGPNYDQNGDPVPPRLIKTHADIGMRIVEGNALKQGTPPIVPPLNVDTNAGDIFIEGEIVLALPSINSDMSGFDYSCSYRQVFLQDDQPRGTIEPGEEESTSTYQPGSYPFAIPMAEAMAAADPNSTLNYSGQIDDDSDEEETTTTTDIDTTTDDWSWYSYDYISSFFSPDIL